MKKEIILEEFKKELPFPFEDMELLKKAFIHTSFLNEKGGEGLESNERLEFLGDSVLSTVISEILYKRFPEESEGRLTHLRAKLVNRRTLAGLARRLDLGEFIYLGKGERASGGADNTAILAGVFEAVIAAVYMERGFAEVFGYIEELYDPLIEELLVAPGHFDFKPALQELAQRLFKSQPVYRVVSEEGPAHDRTFEVEVLIDGHEYGRGTANRKKDAEQKAAGIALKSLSSVQEGEHAT